jgi:hypothetical protein
VTIANQIVSVVQQLDPNCTYTVSRASVLVPSGNQSHQIAVSTTPGCAWTASVLEGSFISLTGGLEGSGSGTVTYSVEENASHDSRVGALAIAGHRLAVLQAGEGGEPTCVEALTPQLGIFAGSGGSQLIQVLAQPSCSWEVVYSTASWVTTSLSFGQGNGTITVIVSPNTGTARSTSLMVGEHLVAISQEPASATSPELEILFKPQDSKVGGCFGNCGAGCSSFPIANCGPSGWTMELIGQPQYVADGLEEVCEGGRIVQHYYGMYVAAVKYTFTGMASATCAMHDASCRGGILNATPGVGWLNCIWTFVKNRSPNYCSGAQQRTWSYTETVTSRTKQPIASVDVGSCFVP